MDAMSELIVIDGRKCNQLRKSVNCTVSKTMVRLAFSICKCQMNNLEIALMIAKTAVANVLRFDSRHIQTWNCNKKPPCGVLCETKFVIIRSSSFWISNVDTSSQGSKRRGCSQDTLSIPQHLTAINVKVQNDMRSALVAHENQLYMTLWYSYTKRDGKGRPRDK